MPIPMKYPNGIVKPYNIVTDEGSNTATIDMYGEVVETRPVDWWTGKPVDGNFIILDEFLKDLKDLEGKSSITVHINSVGGSFYAGLAIYNRLRTLNASITTINDSLAASAGSIIFMAGDKGQRKCYAGSNLMVHNVLGLLYGYYNVAGLRDTIKTLQAHDKALVAAYKEATGLDEETIRSAMAKDTYMTGQEAVDAGWADEVISGDAVKTVNMALSPDKSRLMVNGHAVAACLFGKLPEGIPQMTAEEYAAISADAPSGAELHNSSADPAKQVNNIKNHNGGIETMEIKNVEDMRKAFPEFCAQIENDARAAGTKAERARIQEIDGIQNVVGDDEMVKNAKYGENPISAKDLVYNAAVAQAAAGGKMLAGLMADAANSGAAQVPAAAAPAKEVNPDSPEAMAAQAAADVAMFNTMKNKEVC